MSEHKEIYRGHEISVRREDCLGGWEMTYYSIYRDGDGYECVCDFSEGEDSVEDWVRFMRERIDAELAEPDPWGEEAEHQSFTQ